MTWFCSCWLSLTSCLFCGYLILLLLVPFAQCGNLRGDLILPMELFQGNNLVHLALLSRECSLVQLVHNLWINHSGWDLHQCLMAVIRDLWHPQFWDQLLFMDLEHNFNPPFRVPWGHLLQDIKDKDFLSNTNITKDATAAFRASNWWWDLILLVLTHLWAMALVPNMEDIKGHRGLLIQHLNNLHLNYLNKYYNNLILHRTLCGHLNVDNFLHCPFLLPNPTQSTKTSLSHASRIPLPLHYVNLLKVLKFLKVLKVLNINLFILDLKFLKLLKLHKFTKPNHYQQPRGRLQRSHLPLPPRPLHWNLPRQPHLQTTLIRLQLPPLQLWIYRPWNNVWVQPWKKVWNLWQLHWNLLWPNLHPHLPLLSALHQHPPHQNLRLQCQLQHQRLHQ